MTTNTNQAALEQEIKSLQSYAAEYSEQYGLLSEQLKFMEAAKAEARSSIEALEALAATEGEAAVLLPLGGGVTVKATLHDTKNTLVGIGAGVSVEKSAEEAIAFLKDRITEMDASGKRLTESLTKLSEQMRAVEQRMQEIYASVQQ